MRLHSFSRVHRVFTRGVDPLKSAAHALVAAYHVGLSAAEPPVSESRCPGYTPADCQASEQYPEDPFLVRLGCGPNSQPGRRLPSGTILVDVAAAGDERVVLSARVSSHDQCADLDRQVAGLTEWATDAGMEVGQSVAEVGCGLNGKRPKLARILSDGTELVTAPRWFPSTQLCSRCAAKTKLGLRDRTYRCRNGCPPSLSGPQCGDQPRPPRRAHPRGNRYRYRE